MLLQNRIFGPRIDDMECHLDVADQYLRESFEGDYPEILIMICIYRAYSYIMNNQEARQRFSVIFGYVSQIFLLPSQKLRSNVLSFARSFCCCAMLTSHWPPTTNRQFFWRLWEGWVAQQERRGWFMATSRVHQKMSALQGTCSLS